MKSQLTSSRVLIQTTEPRVNKHITMKYFFMRIIENYINFLSKKTVIGCVSARTLRISYFLGCVLVNCGITLYIYLIKYKNELLWKGISLALKISACQESRFQFSGSQDAVPAQAPCMGPYPSKLASNADVGLTEAKCGESWG